LKQIGWNLSDPEKMVAANILTQLDDDGFVKIDVLELASYYHVPISIVENVISQIQRADPIGSGCEDSQEAMLVQLDELQKIKPIPSGVKKIIADHYEALLRKHFKEIGRALNISQTKVEMAAQFISENLNPFPARANWGDFRNPNEEENTRLGQPDIILSFFEDDPQKAILLEVFQPFNSNLVLNKTYKIAIKESDKVTKDEMKADLNRASLFIKCIQQRANTILQLMEMLVDLQERFIREGDLYLKPITRAQIAKQMDVHESTISRAVSSKTVQMPDKKIYPLAIFFDRSLRIRTLIKEMISAEVKPLSDMEIMKKLEKMDISIARRTVAKYRDMEGIPSAHQRKEK
jgi:RNA polymerase sigma-54 factor